MTINKFIVYYSTVLFLLYQAHIFFLEYINAFSNLIFNSYIFFYLFSVFFFLFIYSKTKRNAQLANIFFIGSTIKLIVFFLIFRPFFYQDNFNNKFEISSFIIPYIFSSAFIIYSLSKLLSNSNGFTKK